MGDIRLDSVADPAVTKANDAIVSHQVGLDQLAPSVAA
jgi:hypothetical protein